MTSSNSNSKLAEKEFFEVLTHAIPGSSVDHKGRRIAGLEELQRRIASNSIQNKNEATRILLNMAKTQGNNRPESSLIVDSLLLFIGKHEEVFQTVLDGLRGREGPLFLCFSKVISSLNYKKKKQSIPLLVDFLMSREALNSIGVKEVHECLVSLGNEKLSREIVKANLPHLESPPTKICAIIYSVRLCAKFADQKLLPKMAKLLQKSMKGYFNGHEIEIERDICQFFERVEDQRSLPVLIELLKARTHYSYDHIVKVVAKVLDIYPNSIEYVIEVLYDNRKNSKIIYAILQCLIEMEAPRIDARRILSSIRLNWWNKYPGVRTSLHTLFVKMGNPSKPILSEILQEKEKYDFALGCLREIGVSNEELSKIFPKPPMLQVYDFLYPQAKSKKFPKDLNLLWGEKEKLHEIVPGATDRLEHLLLHIFTSFNFATLNVAPLKIKSVDIVCFHPKTLNLFIIGCTTGTLQDDLVKMDSLVKKMQAEVTDVFHKCSVTPIVASSDTASISPSNAQYAAENNIVIMQRQEIDTLLEMLNTNRQSREVIEYIKKLGKLPSLPRM